MIGIIKKKGFVMSEPRMDYLAEALLDYTGLSLEDIIVTEKDQEEQKQEEQEEVF